MIGKPKYQVDDLVKIKLQFEDGEKEFTGKIHIIDKYGTFEDNSDVSYDIMVDKFINNEPCLVKHIREDCVKLA